MAFRRFNSSRARFASSRSRFRRRPAMQTPHRPRKWERGNFYIPVEHEHAVGNTSVLTVLPIAQVNRIVDDQATDAGRALSAAARYLEIGGIVYNYVIDRANYSGYDAPVQGDQGTVDCRLLLVSDRLDASTPPQPTCLSTNWFTNTQPVSAVNEAQDEQQTFPTQIHQQHFRRLNFGFLPYPDVTGDYEITTSVDASRGASNLRLRLRLSDDEVLAFHVASRCRDGEDVLNLGIRVLLVGTIFYRFVFGSR